MRSTQRHFANDVKWPLINIVHTLPSIVKGYSNCQGH